MANWIDFVEVECLERPRKTKVFKVKTKEGDSVLGTIKWFGRWRKYSFYPHMDTIFEQTCLRDIAQFIDELMLKRKRERHV